MKVAKFLRCAAAIVAAAGCTEVVAQSLRCNGDLASVGDYQASVIQKCGPPMYTATFCKPANDFRQYNPATGQTTLIVAACERVDEWTYNPGPGQFWTTFRFENGVATAIRYGERVR